MIRSKTSRHPSVGRMYARAGWMYNFAFRRERWLLELMILRPSGHAGRYRNRDRLADFDPIEQVPWA